MIAQRHYAITRELEDKRTQFWRAWGNRYQKSGWTFNMSKCKLYRTPGHAMSAARQIAEVGKLIKVVELVTHTGDTVHTIVLTEKGSKAY